MNSADLPFPPLPPPPEELCSLQIKVTWKSQMKTCFLFYLIFCVARLKGSVLKLTLIAGYYRHSNSRSSIFLPKYAFMKECFITHCKKFISYFVHNTRCAWRALNRLSDFVISMRKIFEISYQCNWNPVKLTSQEIIKNATIISILLLADWTRVACFIWNDLLHDMKFETKIEF
jgi:hypothetical protein